MPLSQDKVQITTEASLTCGEAGAQKAALHQAAIETLQRGFDEFVILDSESGKDIRQVGTSPVHEDTSVEKTVHGNQSFEIKTTISSGGDPIYEGAYTQGITVKMLPAGSGGVDARTLLGPEWETLITRKKTTCF